MSTHLVPSRTVFGWWNAQQVANIATIVAAPQKVLLFDCSTRDLVGPRYPLSVVFVQPRGTGISRRGYAKNSGYRRVALS